MGLSRDEIIDYASRYVQMDEIIDFPSEGDTFCLLLKDLQATPPNTVQNDEEGWGFGGYGLCIGYTLDDQAKPMGKWIWMHFASLSVFPPAPQVLKLQPPHIVKGRFQNPERTHEIRILKIDIGNALKITEGILPTQKKEVKSPAEEKSQTPTENSKENIVQFRKKK